jgi:hypothetical protein
MDSDNPGGVSQQNYQGPDYVLTLLTASQVLQVNRDDI